MMILRRLTASSTVITRTLLKNANQPTYSFSALRKPLKYNLSNEKSIISRNFVKIKVVKPQDNQNKKPFALIKQEPFFLPNNPFKMMFDVFKRRIIIKFEMAKIDPSFRAGEFLNGTQMALMTVSNRISNGNFDDLADLVQPGLIEKIKARYTELTSEEKELIVVNKNHIANQRIIDFDVYRGEGKLFVKMKSLIYIFETSAANPTDLGENMEISDYVSKHLRMAEYTFVRDYSQGSQNSNWIITDLNHYNSDYYGQCMDSRNE